MISSCHDFDTKRKAQRPESVGIRGFVPGETAKGETRKDHKEFYHVGREAVTEEQLKRSRNFPNVWPEEVKLKEPMTQLFHALEKHMIPIQEAIAEALELPSNFLTDMTKNGNVLLRALYYPANPPPNSIWGGAHTDIDFFTILPKSTAEGLQIKNKEREWITVRVPKNSFVINAGDMLENITHGFFRSAVHQVIDTGHHQARYSMVMFVHPRSDDDVSPLPHLVQKTGGIVRYPKVREEEMLFERLGSLGYATLDQLKKLAESGAVDRMIDFDRASLATMKKLRENGIASPKVLKEIERLEALPKSLKPEPHYS